MDFRQGLGSETMSVGDVAAFLAGSREWVRQLILAGQLDSFRIRGKTYVSKESLRRLVAEQRAVPVDDVDLQAELAARRQERQREKQGRHAVNQASLFAEEES